MVSNDTRDKRTKAIVICSVVLLFLTFIVVDIVFICLAQKTDNGQVTQNAYNKGLAYNEVIAANKWQVANGFMGEIELDCDGYRVYKYEKGKNKKLTTSLAQTTGHSPIYCNALLLLKHNPDEKSVAGFNTKLIPNDFAMKITRKVTSNIGDIKAILHQVENNKYQSSVVLPAAGLWQIRLHGDINNHHSLYFSVEVVVESKPTL